MQDIYEALRAGPGWNKTLFVIVYDDGGDFYDHVVSPFEGVPGLLRLHHVQHMFERHASGQGRDRAVNQRAFQAFCEEMGMVNPGARTHAP